jgi:hypothetical protein
VGDAHLFVLQIHTDLELASGEKWERKKKKERKKWLAGCTRVGFLLLLGSIKG